MFARALYKLPSKRKNMHLKIGFDPKNDKRYQYVTGLETVAETQ